MSGRADLRRRVALYAALFLASFAGVAGVVRSALPWPAATGLRAKFAAFEEHADALDVVFLGSSNVLHSVLPEEFERAAAREGRELETFNFGVPGMYGLEAEYVAAELLALQPARLRWLVAELRDWRLDARAHLATSRTIRWHTPALTLAAMQNDWELMPSARLRWDALLGHALLCGQNLTNTGALAEVGAEWLGMRPPARGPADQDYVREDGYVALEEHDPGEGQPSRQRFLEDPASLEALVGELARAEQGQPESEVLPHNLRGAARLRELARAHGVELAGLICSADTTELGVAEAAAAAGIETILAFNRPGAFPELYAPESRYDLGHLQRRGARVFTRSLARAFLDAVGPPAQ